MKRAFMSDRKLIPNFLDFICHDGKIRTPEEANGKQPIAICIKVDETEAIFMYVNCIDDVCWSPTQYGNICPNKSDGLKNTEIVLNKEDYSADNYPAFYKCNSLNEIYTKVKWYMPSINEISNLFVSNRDSIQSAFSLASISSNITFDEQPKTNDIRYLASNDNYMGNPRQCSAYSMASMNDTGRWKYAINDNYMGVYSYSKVIPFSKFKL